MHGYKIIIFSGRPKSLKVYDMIQWHIGFYVPDRNKLVAFVEITCVICAEWRQKMFLEVVTERRFQQSLETL